MIRTLTLIATMILMAGCAAQPDLKPLSNDDPANPQAPEAPVTLIAAPLTLELPPGGTSDSGSPDGTPMRHMDMKGMDMKGMDMHRSRTGQGQSPPATQPDMEGMHRHSHSGAATQALYTCKMHPQIVSVHPGNCPICGMKLVPKEGGK